MVVISAKSSRVTRTGCSHCDPAAGQGTVACGCDSVLSEACSVVRPFSSSRSAVYHSSSASSLPGSICDGRYALMAVLTAV
eukprot:scaffold20432_cov70-Phaeocystis_antarctica.AAC.7